MDERRELWWPSPATERAEVVQVRPEGGFTTLYGATLDGFQVAYESWGTPSEARDNVVLIVHPVALDAHVSGGFDGQAPGWWEDLIGPGRAIDTERDFVVCPNLLGGCYGTTGPRFPAPDGEPFLDRFPLLHPRDLMRFQRLFLDAIGVERPRMVVGPSMGGMVAWEWALAPDTAAQRVAIVAAPAETSPYQIGFNWLQFGSLEQQLQLEGKIARRAHALARGAGMLSYRSEPSLLDKFGRSWFKPPGATLAERGTFNVESWLRHQGTKSAKRFDPYSYMLLSRAMDLHDIGHERGADEALAACACPVLLVGIDTDRLYPASQVRGDAERLEHAGARVTYDEIRSPHGHDAIFLEIEALSAAFRAWES
ncbi:MAG: homoserine O-acetyltransferase [bacterium]|nr:homoserine O-acetyltransferase [bacterium]